MIKTVEETTIIINNNTLMLTNGKNRARFRYDSKDGSVSFSDSNGNMVQNYGSTISINFEVFKLTHLGQTINRNDGTMIACLRDKDIQELAEKTFFDEGQLRVYDFMNLKFTIEL
ncbi:hypothetical protein FNW52_14365 [Flavobacterium sp. ZT3R18]|uniref:hypothetical protein n=1 Tax=Flavobacterium sp. ZT3R18 TaxID=2594429 RepID=UPI00117B5C2A|nr:hypothetical protein [Flavobacterium sp. ZT3R18]TRX34213.1 hypothetical protein FNW52_14365 [Flavobacterium sp. ZT3R18]